MDQGTLEVLQGITGFIAFTGMILKYNMHFQYRKSYDLSLKNVSFMGFLTTFGQYTQLKLAFSIPWIWRNRIAEAQVPGLKRKGQLIFLLCLLFGLVFIAIGILSDYEKTME